MSHYAVLVLSKQNQEIDELLAPYSENIKVSPYLEYTKKEALDIIKKHYVPYNDKLKIFTKDELIQWFVNINNYSIGKDGNIYSTYNPDSKWDWYSYGGRFSDSLKLKNSDDWVDSALVKNIDWGPHLLTDKEKNKIRRWWEINIYGYPLKAGEKKDENFIWNKDWYKARYRDAETYILIQSSISFHSIITPDGVWHEPSKMGYFACTNGKPEMELEWDLNFKKTFIDTADPEWVATVIDCHI